MKASFLSTISLALLGSLAFAAPSHAGLVTQYFTGNDCGNPNCVANENGTFSNTAASGSPFIIKFDIGDNGITTEINPLYGSIDGSEFYFTPDLSDSSKTGTWTYSPNDALDPAIRFWTAKGGPNYNLFYFDGPDADLLADTVTSGTWETPLNPNNNKLYGLSHISFYDTGTPPNDVPEPATLALFGMGLLGLGVLARRRKTA